MKVTDRFASEESERSLGLAERKKSKQKTRDFLSKTSKMKNEGGERTRGYTCLIVSRDGAESGKDAF